MTYLSATRSLGQSRLGWTGIVAHYLDVWRQRRHLARLDDSALRDIGLTHAEIDAEIRRPIWDAPASWQC